MNGWILKVTQPVIYGDHSFVYQSGHREKWMRVRSYQCLKCKQDIRLVMLAKMRFTEPMGGVDSCREYIMKKALE